MGRPKKYKRDEVLKKAMSLFWQRGFADTGLQDLEKATGVNKSGLYTEFKDKEEMFTASLLYYYAHRGSEKFLIREPLGWDNIEMFFKFISAGWSGLEGCISINSMRELKILPSESQTLVAESRIELKNIFQRNIETEQTKMSAQALAEITATFFSGFCIEQNMEGSEAANNQLIEDFMKLLRGM